MNKMCYFFIQDLKEKVGESAVSFVFLRSTAEPPPLYSLPPAFESHLTPLAGSCCLPVEVFGLATGRAPEEEWIVRLPLCDS